MNLTTIITDEAYGVDVPGKHSPDGSFHEWQYSRKLCRALRKELNMFGISNYSNVPEENEPGLTERISRANSIQSRGAKVLLSFRNNITSNDNVWRDNRGVEICTYSLDNDAEKIANIFTGHMEIDFPMITQKRSFWNDRDIEEETDITSVSGIKKDYRWVLKPNYYGIIIKTLYVDNKDDLELLKSEKFFEEYIDFLVRFCIDVCGYFGDSSIIKEK